MAIALAIIGIVAIAYGGGQIPSANIVIGKLTEKLLERNAEVYGVHKSFLGLADSSCFEKFTLGDAREIQMQLGTYLPTCRKVDPSKEPWFYRIYETLVKLQVNYLFIPGGDGSSRAARDFLEALRKLGYNLQIIFIPCTIDGITNSDTIGIDSAVAESFRHVCAMIVNAFATWNPNYVLPRVPIIEIQGRNRNDIAVGVVRNIIKAGKIGKYRLNDFDLIFVPAAYCWSYKKLLQRIYSSDKPCAIIIAEGAVPTEKNWNLIPGKGVGQKLEFLFGFDDMRECNLDVVGYMSQTNDSITEAEIEKIDAWVSFAVDFLANNQGTGESFAIVKNGEEFSAMPLKEFADATDSDKAVPLNEDELKEFANYLP